MWGLCSVCILESPHELTPLFTKNGNTWQSTVWSRMLETVLEKRIMKGREALLAICTKCIYRICKALYENDFVEKKNICDFWADEFLALAPVIEKDDSQEKVGAEKRSKIKKFKRAFSVLVDEEEATRKKKIKTTDELKIIKFEVQENRDYINCLPLECMAEIFMYLSLPERLKMERVCHRWKDASNFTWGNIKNLNLECVGWNPRESDETVARILSRCGRYLKVLDTDDFYSYKIMSAVRDCCQNLEEIRVNVENCDDDTIIKNAFSMMEKLKEIQVYIKPTENDTWDFADVLSSVTENIEKIDLRSGSILRGLLCHNDSKAAQIFNRFQGLRSLTLSSIDLNNHAMAGISIVTTLVEVTITSCHFYSGALLISDLPNLEVLKYESNKNDSQSLISFMHHCKNLKKLDINTGHLSTAAVNSLRELKQLENFTIRYKDKVDNNVIGILAESCQNLTHLDLSENSVDFGFQNLASLKNLEHLNLWGTEKVTDYYLSRIAMKCNKLRYLNFGNCGGITNFGLRKFGNLINLEGLNLGGTEHVDDSVIFSITSNCMKLKELSLENQIDISKSALETLVHLEDLEDLDINPIENVDDSVVLKIAENCKKLKRLNISSCVNVSDKAIKKVIDNCPNLEFLAVFDTNMTKDTLLFAVEKTKFRSNNIILEILADPSLEFYCKAYTDKSRFLILDS